MKLKGYAFGCLSSATYGLIPLFSLPLLKGGLALDSLLFYRFSCAALIIAVYMILKKQSLKIRKSEILPLAVLGVLFALSAQFLFSSYNYMPSGIAATILFIYPVIVAIIMAVFFHEKISWITQLAIILAFTGVALLYGGDGKVTLNIIGVILILLSALTYALYIITINKSRVSTMSAFKLTFYAMAFSALFFFAKSMISGGLHPLPDSSMIINILLLALLSTAISCIAMAYSVHYIGSTMTAVLGAMEPLTAVCVGVIVFNEPFTPNLALGILLIISAVMLIILSNRILKSVKHLQHHRQKTT
ncbi:MAG: DMT family transporter [Dysgonomonas sp.]